MEEEKTEGEDGVGSVRHEAGHKDGHKQRCSERWGSLGKMKETQGGSTLQNDKKKVHKHHIRTPGEMNLEH